jgi:hypothetical protein
MFCFHSFHVQDFKRKIFGACKRLLEPASVVKAKANSVKERASIALQALLKPEQAFLKPDQALSRPLFDFSGAFGILTYCNDRRSYGKSLPTQLLFKKVGT